MKYYIMREIEKSAKIIVADGSDPITLLHDLKLPAHDALGLTIDGVKVFEYSLVPSRVDSVASEGFISSALKLVEQHIVNEKIFNADSRIWCHALTTTANTVTVSYYFLKGVDEKS